MDGRVLDPGFWEGSGSPELRVGEWDDSLRGVVRFHEAEVDLIVGHGHAMRFAVETAEVHLALGFRVATPLVLLKLEASGPGDRSDIIGLVDAERQLGDEGWLAEIAQHLPRLSDEARACYPDLSSNLTPYSQS